MSVPAPVKKAEIVNPNGRQVLLLLIRYGEKRYVWQTPTGELWEPCSGEYDEEPRAIKQLRVAIDTDPALVGYKLTIKPMLPPPSERLAKKIITRYGISTKLEAELIEIIDRETNLDHLIDSGETMLGYFFKNRAAYAAALFPVVQGRMPRDITLDGIILAFIEAIEKAKGQDFTSLKKILAETVSAIMVPGRPEKGGVIH